MKKFEKKIGIEKRFIHVRINTSGSFLERSSGVYMCVCVCILEFIILFFFKLDFFGL